MIKSQGHRRCACCGQLFSPDPRCRERQRYCAEPGCRKVSKAASQQRWKTIPANRDYWAGPLRVSKVRAWRENHPGYWRKTKKRGPGRLQDERSTQSVHGELERPGSADGPLQDEWQRESPLVVGLVAMLAGRTLQEDIASVCRDLIAKGREILGARNPKNGEPA